ncbi:MAG: PEP-CTERM sorting domain-containing protein [Candidatus Omnitrophica bacterium]|nr:PEP-CTERM sorting domain-containing protein [Candidatus Omnitrophota bacterium]
MLKKTAILLFIVISISTFPNIAHAFTINTADGGNLLDWGVTPSSDAITEHWEPYPGIFHEVEDYVSPGGQVYPGWGGQQFDAEALYLNWNDTTLYLALVTGFPNTTTTAPGYNHSAGDIAIDFGANGTYEYGIEIGGHKGGSYSGLAGIPGQVYEGIDWKADDLWNGVSTPLYMKTATDTGYGAGANFIYTLKYDNEGSGYDHYVVEMSVPRIAFGSDWNDYMRVHWTQSCGNDNINVTTVPEPMSMSLLGLGLLGVIGLGIRRRK